MKKLIVLLTAALLLHSCNENNPIEALQETKEYPTAFELGNGNQTATYKEVIKFYKELSTDFSNIEMEEIGQTDSGKPLHLVSFSNSKINWNSAHEDKIKILINNGIHPGESDGIDATMMLMRDLATGAIEAPENLIFSTIAIYNVGGSLNRNSSTRTNQNGPEEYGFRGNARNYDLNRDFIKADSRNALAFYDVYHKINPDIFIDNHVSNGADYQYTLTHLFTQHNKLAGAAGDYLHTQLQPQLEKRLAQRDLPITPYVNVHNASPVMGFSQFMDYPRYSTGYTSLWNTLGMMVETHMLKPYKDRVLGTKAIMEEMIAIGSENVDLIKKVRKKSFNRFEKSTYYVLNYSIDKTQADTLDFLGYEAIIRKSDVTGNDLLTYDRSKPLNKKTVYHNYYKATDSVTIPDYYVVPQSQWKVIELMRRNNIQYEFLTKDTTLTVSKYRIANFKTAQTAYEGHYPHHDINVKEDVVELRFRESDIIIPTHQPGMRYIIETLEPTAPDSFFKWNYFDTILQQKEGFSTYVFEATARQLLKKNKALKREFDSLKKIDRKFKQNNYLQLDWIHKRSLNYEPAHLNYPIYKWNK
ncbi:M14 family metallopeptidase [uncultured Nonlabens sp.]|uniref:M14 family metallopeptidase n=1 Tax=uncultured Nonlabens sp. TaxID=859306 RepID=UPI002627CB12|nr:M14 family metallopeptidase [uncultured Nonlabens sp.]